MGKELSLLKDTSNRNSYTFEDPIERAKCWIEEQKEKREL